MAKSKSESKIQVGSKCVRTYAGSHLICTVTGVTPKGLVTTSSGERFRLEANPAHAYGIRRKGDRSFHVPSLHLATEADLQAAQARRLVNQIVSTSGDAWTALGLGRLQRIVAIMDEKRADPAPDSDQSPAKAAL